MAATLTPADARSEMLSCDEPGAAPSLTIRFDARVHEATVVVRSAPGTLIEIEEIDLDLMFEHDQNQVLLDSEVPPRYGRGFRATNKRDTTLRLARIAHSRARGAAIIRLHCLPGVATTALANWMQELGQVAATAQAMPIEPATADVLVSELSALTARAPDAWSLALSRHWEAQALFLSGQTERATKAFDAATQAWHVVPDMARAAAANVAHVEDLQRLGRTQEVLERTARVTIGAVATYYPTRLLHARCVAQRYLARYDEADACFRAAMKAFAAMDERSELVSVVQNYSELKHLQGRDHEAEEMARNALDQIAGPDAAMLRGRIQYLRADIAVNRAQLPEALALLQQSIIDFRAAGLPRWEGNMLLKVSSLQRELGAIPEAYSAVMLAFQRFSLKDSPARVAASLVTLARIDEIDGHDRLAAFWLMLAEHLYTELGMNLELDGVRASLANLALARADVAQAKHLLDAADPALSFYGDRWALARAQVQSLAGEHAAALATLDAVPKETLSLQMHIAHAIAYARASVRAGESDSAIDTLERLRAQIERTAASARSPLLRYLLARRLEQVEGAFVTVLLQRNGTKPMTSMAALEALWPMLQRRTALMDLAPAGDASATLVESTLDREIAANLLLGQPRSTQATSELLGLLTRDARTEVISRSIPSPAEFATALPPDLLVLSHADIGDRGLLVWIGRDIQYVTETPPKAVLRGLVANLRTALADPKTQLHEIDRHAIALSNALLGASPVVVAPARLRIDRDSILAGMPWPALRWPGQRVPIADHTAVSLAPLRSAQDYQRTPLASFDILIAGGQVDGVAGNMQDLPGVLSEARTIRRLAEANGKTVNVLPAARRADVLTSLSNGGAMHVAAHGVGDPGSIGYSGLWLARHDGVGIEFLGWTEPLMRGVRSQMIVLSACSLARAQDAADASMSFASALARAGAADVVAALWSTSDAATAVWVPAYYEALWRDSTHNPEVAVSAAISALRSSRMFRHPFYWASLVHLTEP